MPHYPKISFVVPVYKVEAYLEECVESILCQNSLDFEVVLVDDGSPDRCGEICDTYAAKYAHVKSVHRENGGLSAARNTGLEHAAGEWVVYVDSDDWLEPGFGEAVSPHLGKPLDIIVYGYQEARPDKLVPFRPTEAPLEIHDEADCLGMELCSINRFAESDRFYSKGFSLCSAWLKVYRRTFLAEHAIRFYDGYFEDVLYSAEVFHNNPQTLLLPDILYNYRKREGSILQGFKQNAQALMDPHVEQVWRYIDTYHKDDAVFFSAACARVYTVMLYLLVLYFCSAQNGTPYKARKAEWNKKLQTQNYARAFKHIGAVKGFPISRQVPSYLIRCRQFWLLDIFCKVKAGRKKS